MTCARPAPVYGPVLRANGGPLHHESDEQEGPVAHDERVACTVCGQRNHRDTLVCPACGARRAGAEDLRRQAFQVFWPLTLGAG